MAERTKTAKKTHKGQRGHSDYGDAFKRVARDLWAAGEYNSDEELAEALGVPRRATIATWRAADEPDGIPWVQRRDEMARARDAEVDKRVAEGQAEMLERHMKLARSVQSIALRFLMGQELTLADGSVVRLPLVGPETFSESVSALEKAVKMERQARGEPDMRVEQFVSNVGAAIRRVLEQTGMEDEELTAIEEQLAAEVNSAMTMREAVDDNSGGGDLRA